MVLTHTCESAGVRKNIKVNGQSRPAKLSGILLTWHLILVNWTFQLTDGYICSCPLPSPPHHHSSPSSMELLHFLPHLLSFLFSTSPLPPLHLSYRQMPLSFLVLLILFLLQLPFLLLPQTCFLFFSYWEASELSLYWLAYSIRLFTVLLEPCVVLVFQTTTHRLPLNLPCLFLIIPRSRCPCSLLRRLKEVLGCPVVNY